MASRMVAWPSSMGSWLPRELRGEGVFDLGLRLKSDHRLDFSGSDDEEGSAVLDRGEDEEAEGSLCSENDAAGSDEPETAERVDKSTCVGNGNVKGKMTSP